MLRLSERPADVVLADTALTRPDTVGLTQRVLARAPGATIVLFGSEDPRTAAAAVAAGARGLIQGGDQDLVSVVAKAVLLLCVTGRMPRRWECRRGRRGRRSASPGSLPPQAGWVVVSAPIRHRRWCRAARATARRWICSRRLRRTAASATRPRENLPAGRFGR